MTSACVKIPELDADRIRSPTLTSLIEILVPSSLSTSSSAAKQVFSAIVTAEPRTDELEAGAIAGGATGTVDVTGAAVEDSTDGTAEMGDIVGADGALLGTVDGESEVGDMVGAVGAIDGSGEGTAVRGTRDTSLGAAVGSATGEVVGKITGAEVKGATAVASKHWTILIAKP
jgi:hypothetical protein